MATARLVRSTYYLSNENYLTASGTSNMYTNVDSTTSGTFTHTRASTNSTYYAYLRGFDFNTIPLTATVNSFTVKIKASATGHTTSTSSSYYMSLYNGTTSIGSTTASGRLSTSTNTFTFSNGSMTWSTLKGYGANFGIRIPLRRASSNTADVVTVYGAEILVDYTPQETVHVTGVSLDKHTDTIQEEATTQLTETVSPNNATDKTVAWSSSNTSVATVGGGLVTGVSPGTATITVTTNDGSYTDTCVVTVTEAVRTDYVLTSTLSPGKEYIIANGDSGSVYMLSSVAGASQQLVGVSATVSSNKISITDATAATVVFACALSDPDNSVTTHLTNNNQYLRANNANGLHMSNTDDRWWHLRDSKFWLWTGSADDGYTDNSSNYKYYLQCSGSGIYTVGHVDTTPVANSTLPAMYLFVKDTGGGGNGQVYVKENGSWHTIGSVYVKQSGSWVLQPDPSTVFDVSAYYMKG